MNRHRLTLGVLCLMIAAGTIGDAAAIEVQNVDVYRVPGRFGGWPANHGIWSWGDEILVGFGAGYYKDLGASAQHRP